jgi:putative transposase
VQRGAAEKYSAGVGKNLFWGNWLLQVWCVQDGPGARRCRLRASLSRTLAAVDAYTRECLALKVDRGITSDDVIDTLSDLFTMRGVPRDIRGDHGPEFIAQALRHWLDAVGVGTLYIEPGSPWEDGYAKSFHGRFRDEFLAMEIFDGVWDPRSLTTAWRVQDNAHRPLSPLGYLTPARFAAACTASASAKASPPAAHAGANVQPCC